MLRKLVPLFALCLLAVGLVACDDDEVTAVVEYDITIVNNDDVAYEVWVDANVDVEGFVRDGSVEASGSRVFLDRVIAVGYHFRLLNPGQDPEPPADEFEYEQNITSNGPDFTWTVPPPTP